MLDHQADEIGRMGSRAKHVAGTVANILPEICTTVVQVEESGHSVLTTADDLVGRSRWLVEAVSRYFSNLDSFGVQPNMAEALSRILRVCSPEILFERLHLVFETKFNLFQSDLFKLVLF